MTKAAKSKTKVKTQPAHQEAQPPKTFVCDGGRTVVVNEVCPFCKACPGDMCGETWGR